MPRHRMARRGLGYGSLCGLALALPGILPASAETLRFPLTCTLRTISVGQFHGSDYAPGPAGSLGTVAVAASPTDLRLGRAALIEGSHAQVTDLSLRPERATLFGEDAHVTTVLAIFTATAADGGFPATYFRNELIGSIPVMIQSTGSCRSAS